MQTSFHIENYQLFKKIGQGGFGQVYKAKNLKTDQWVAIKFLNLEQQIEPEKKQRYIELFERESLLSGRLQHPNIVRLLDKGRCSDDILYAVFEYIEGCSLKERLAEQGPLSPIEAAPVMAEVLDALAHAHQKGVIHRDIKPSNIMLTQLGAKTHARVLDFGIGTLVYDARHQDYKSLTLTQETLGTPSYSAPEQLRGEAPTPKTDLYVWALVFIECLTGQPAVGGASLASIFHKQLSPSNIPLPAGLAGHPVAGLLRKMLAKKTADRLGKAAEAYRQLTQINFSTLVGNISSVSSPAESSSDIVAHDSDLTLLEQNSLYNSILVENKQITTLCIILTVENICKSTQPADVIDSLHRDQKTHIVDCVVEFGGFHVGSLADTLIFYFGYPTTSDSDTRLAARAALEICSQINKRNSLLKITQKIRFAASAAIHSGEITIFPDMVPDGSAANVSTALARLAGTNQVICSHSVKNSLDNFIEFSPHHTTYNDISLGELALFNIIGERQIEALGFLRAQRNKHSFIGRTEELSQLSRQLAVEHGEEKAPIYLYGEAGIGKSRLSFELRNRAMKFDHFVAQCLPEKKNNALRPILELLHHKLSLDHSRPQKNLTKLVPLLAGLDHAKVIPIIYAWFNMPLPHGYQVNTDLPEQQKQSLFEALALLLVQLPEHSPHMGRLILLEDLHWSDPTTLEFVAYFVTCAIYRQSTSVVVCTSRRKLEKPLPKEVFLRLEVKRLNHADTAAMVTAMFGQQQLSEEMLTIISRRTDGVPLFIEELVNMVKQQKLVSRINGITDFTDAQQIKKIPINLRDSLQQKLDALKQAKETAQLAAAMGREFDYALLAAASIAEEGELQNHIAELLQVELVYQQRKVDGDVYIFKHALVRDAAYESMPTEKRLQSHGQIAVALESHFPQRVESDPFALALHYAKSANFTKAVEYGLLQVQQSRDLSANKETLAFCSEVLQWALQVRDSEAKLLFELQLNQLQFPACMAVNGFGSNALVTLSQRIAELYQATQSFRGTPQSDQEAEVHFLSQWVLFVDHQFHSRCHQAIELAKQIIEQAQACGQRQHELLVLPLLGQTYHLAGLLQAGKESCERALAILNEAEDKDLWKTYGMEVKSQALFLLSHILACQGEIDSAAEKAQQALNWAKQSGCTMFIDGAYVFCSMVAYLAHNRQQVLALESDHRSFHRGCLNPEQWLVASAMMGYDWAHERCDHHAAYLTSLFSTGRTGAMCWWEAMLAETHIARGDWQLASQSLDACIARCIDSGEVAALPLLYRCKALALCSKYGEYTQEVDSVLSKGLHEAQRQEARWLALDCYFHKMHLISQQATFEKNVQSHQQIMQQFGITQGFDCPLVIKLVKLTCKTKDFSTQNEGV